MCARPPAEREFELPQSVFPNHAQRVQFAASVRRGDLRGIGKTARRLIESVQPYHAANGHDVDEPLYILHRMWIWDKHRTLLGVDPIWFVKPQAGTEVDPINLSKIQRFFSERGPLKDGTRLTFDLPDTEPENQMPFELTMTELFAKGVPGEGRPVAALLRQLADSVDKTLQLFDPLFV